MMQVRRYLAMRFNAPAFHTAIGGPRGLAFLVCLASTGTLISHTFSCQTDDLAFDLDAAARTGAITLL